MPDDVWNYPKLPLAAWNRRQAMLKLPKTAPNRGARWSLYARPKPWAWQPSKRQSQTLEPTSWRPWGGAKDGGV
eukprot:15473034-Alexandrium_andersonii.AAC.1